MWPDCGSIVWLILCALTYLARMKLSRSSCADRRAFLRWWLLQLRRAQKKPNNTNMQQQLFSSSQTLAAAHDLRIYFGRTLAPPSCHSHTGPQGGDFTQPIAPPPTPTRCPLPQRRIRQSVERQHAGVLRRKRRR